MTHKRERFVEEYLIDFNASAAMRRAGYTSKNPDVDGHKLLVNPSIQAALAERRKELSAKAKITQERVLAEYAKVAFSDMTRFAEWGPAGVTLKNSSELDPADAACVAEVSQSVTEAGGTIRFKLHDKKGALDSICKMLGFNAPDETKHTGDISIKVSNDELAKYTLEELAKVRDIHMAAIARSDRQGTG